MNDVFIKTVGARFSRELWTLDQMMQFAGLEWVEGATPRITFDPSLRKQYRIIARHSHDGTLLFTIKLVQEQLWRMIAGVSYYKPMGEPEPDQEVHYTIGHARVARVFGMVNLPAGRYPGIRESIVIPVRCEYRTREEA